MSFEHLLQATQPSPTPHQTFQYGQQCLWFSGQLPEGVEVGLMVYSQQPEAFEPVREELYSLAANFKKGKFIDFGNVVGGKFGLTEVISQLLQKKIFPIVLTDQGDTVSALLDGHPATSLEISLIDSHLSEPLHQALAFYPDKLFHCNCIGYQSYFVDEQLLDELYDHHHTTYRLSYMRAELEEAEPIVRDSDILYFHLPAVRAADAPAAVIANPSGFLSEEACRIIRYAAMADRLSCLAIGGFAPNINDRRQTAKLLAQLVWFAVEGFSHRKNEYPLDTQRLTQYIVESRWVDFPLKFFKSPRSERWWFWVPLPEGGSNSHWSRHQLVACSYQDYQKACEGELPERLLEAYRRFE